MNAMHPLAQSSLLAAVQLPRTSATDPCGLCGTQKQFHGRGECKEFLPLPDPAAWHRTSEVRALIADMKMIDAVGRAMEARYRDTCARFGFGQLEVTTSRFGGTPRYEADGDVGQLLGMIETARCDAIDAERLRVFPESYSSHSDLFDDFSETLDAHFDSVAKAVEA